MGKLKLSKTQKEIIKLLEQVLFIWTNEGANFKAWIGDSEAVKVKGIRVSSAEALLNQDKIKFVDGEYRQGLFKYELVAK